MNATSTKIRKKLAARKPIGKVELSATAKGLTRQAGLIPAVKHLGRMDFENIVIEDVPHHRGCNADYQLADVTLLALVGMIGGASPIAKPCAIWSDGVLRGLAGWVKLPVDHH